MSDIQLYNGDCLEIMDKLIAEGVKVDFAFADLPYNETGNKWDNKIDHKVMFDKLKVLCKDEAAMAFTGTFRFGVDLYNACPELYKYDWVWEKDNGTNFIHANNQPIRNHEQIFVFGKGKVAKSKNVMMKYNPQMTEGKPYVCKSGKKSENWKGGQCIEGFVTVNTGKRFPKTIQKFIRDRGLHPTQKPLALMEYLVKTYTNEGDTVIDFTMGSGTTGKACKNLNRNFIGIELDFEYYMTAYERING